MELTKNSDMSSPDICAETLKSQLDSAVLERKKAELLDNLSKQPLSAEPMLQWFEYEHLPPHLQVASAPFCLLAHRVARDLPRNAERTVALRKLLEAKDAGVRALLSK